MRHIDEEGYEGAETMCINSSRDIDVYIDGYHPDFSPFQELRTHLRDVIQEADHPMYGSDWGPWLAKNIEALREEAVERAEP